MPSALRIVSEVCVRRSGCSPGLRFCGIVAVPGVKGPYSGALIVLCGAYQAPTGKEAAERWPGLKQPRS